MYPAGNFGNRNAKGFPLFNMLLLYNAPSRYKVPSWNKTAVHDSAIIALAFNVWFVAELFTFF